MGQGQNLQRCFACRDSCGKQCAAFPRLPPFLSPDVLLASHGSNDKERFERAFERNDLEELVSLLQSHEPIVISEERIHPWAQDPRTVGALAATQIAILAAAADKTGRSNKGSRGLKDRIRLAGAIVPLVGFLSSDQVDRVHAAIVALSFLAADESRTCAEIHDAGAMKTLLPFLAAPIEGMRAASASILRCLFVENDAYRREFVELGGIRALVELLDSCPSAQLDAVLNLQDLIEDSSGCVLREYAEAALRAGVEPKLTALCREEDEDVRSSAQAVLVGLHQAMERPLA